MVWGRDPVHTQDTDKTLIIILPGMTVYSVVIGIDVA